MGALIFKLDGVEYPDAVVDDKNLVTTLKRDSSLGGFLESQDAKFTFIGLAYDYLKDKFNLNQNGYCQLVEVEILENCEDVQLTLYNGLIKTSDIEFINKPCKAIAIIFDNSYFALIDNNKEVEVNVQSSNRTKNAEVITPVTLYDIGMFNPATGGGYGTPLKGFWLKDIIEFVLAWVSDNAIGLESDYLDNSGMFVSDGLAINTLGDAPSGGLAFSFASIMAELNAKQKMAFKMIVDDSGNLIMKLETSATFFSGGKVLTLNDAESVKTKAEKKSLFAAVRVGSDVTDDSPAYSFPENANLYGFREEQFTSTGQCNIVQVDDRVSKWVYSSNVIEAQLTGSDNYDDKTFIIECDTIDHGAHTAAAIRHDIFNISPTKRFYNMGFNNLNTINKLYGIVHNTLIGESIQPADRFKAYISAFYSWRAPLPAPLALECEMFNLFPFQATFAPSYCLDPFLFTNEVSDPNNNYDPVTSFYTVPSDGLYNFNVNLKLTVSTSGTWPVYNTAPHGTPILKPCLQVIFIVQVVLRDSTGALIKEIQEQRYHYNAPQTVTINTSGNFDCKATDKVNVRIWSHYYNSVPFCDPVNIHLFLHPLFTFWEMTGGYLFNEVNAARVITHETDYPLTPDQFRILQAFPEGLVTITSHGETFEGYVDRAEHQHFKNKLRIKVKNTT